MLGDIARTLGQIDDPRFRAVLLKGVGLTVALLMIFYLGIVWLVGWLVPESLTLPLLGEVQWLDNIAKGASLLGAILLSSFLMIPVASAFTGMFLDQVADAVEDVHYPDLPDVTPLPVLTVLVDSLRFLGVLIVANLLALVVYAIFPPFAPLIFWALNGFLLGREYFQLVAIRRVGPTRARQLRRRFRGRIWLLGGLMAVPLTIPILNLVVPILGAASFTHFYHRVVKG